MARFSHLIAICLLSAAGAGAQAADADARCAAAGKLRYPEGDFPLAAQARMLEGCRASDYYYGIRQPRDFTKARHCALLPRTRDDVFSGNEGVLMMLYANGEGVPRNVQLARKAACAAGGAPMELVGRLDHLDELQASRASDKRRIDYCDDITSGLMMGYCASLGADRAVARREAAFNAVTAAWSAPERAAFLRLRRQADAFVEARGRNEVDIGGTARGAMVIEEEESLRDAFLAALKAFEAGKLPRFDEAQYAALDRELNTVYRKLGSLPDLNHGTVAMADIRATQRVWLRYRDAWVEFGKVRYPAVPAHAWRAHVTRERIAMLKAFIDTGM